MSEEITTETAQSETEAKQSNMSVSEFTSRRLGQMTPAVEAKEEEAQGNRRANPTRNGHRELNNYPPAPRDTLTIIANL